MPGRMAFARRRKAHEISSAGEREKNVPISYRCDLCGRYLAANSTERFIVKIEAFAAADRLIITEEDLAKDHTQAIRETIEGLSRQSIDEIEDSVYRCFRYDLCKECHRRLLRQVKPGLQNL